MRWIAMVLQVVLGLLFLASAISKLTGGVEDVREQLLIPPWFWTVTALTEIVGGVGLLAGLKSARLAALSGLWLAAVMAGGVLAHLRAADPPSAAIPAAVLLALSLTVAALRAQTGRIVRPAAGAGSAARSGLASR